MYESQGIPYAKQQYIQSFVCNSYKVQKQLQHMQTWQFAKFFIYVQVCRKIRIQNYCWNTGNQLRCDGFVN